MANQLNINKELGPLFTVKVVADEPTKQMFTLSVGLKSSTYEGPQGIQGIQGPSGPPPSPGPGFVLVGSELRFAITTLPQG